MGVAAAAPIVETFAPSYGAYGSGAYGAPVAAAAPAYGAYGAPVAAAAPMVGSISAALPMTTMAAPMPMTTMAAPMPAVGFGTTTMPAVGTSYGMPPTIL